MKAGECDFCHVPHSRRSDARPSKGKRDRYRILKDRRLANKESGTAIENKDDTVEPDRALGILEDTLIVEPDTVEPDTVEPDPVEPDRTTVEPA